MIKYDYARFKYCYNLYITAAVHFVVIVTVGTVINKIIFEKQFIKSHSETFEGGKKNIY